MRIKHPKEGDKRSRRGFLWFPRRINYETRWWEWSEWVEIWLYIGIQEPTWEWVAVEWLDQYEDNIEDWKDKITKEHPQ